MTSLTLYIFHSEDGRRAAKDSVEFGCCHVPLPMLTPTLLVTSSFNIEKEDEDVNEMSFLQEFLHERYRCSYVS